MQNRWKPIKKRLRSSQRLFFEAYDRCLDFSLQLDVDASESVEIFSRNVFRSTPRGHFEATCLAPGAWHEAWASLGHVALAEWLAESLRSSVGRALRCEGYEGPCGVDGFLYREQGRCGMGFPVHFHGISINFHGFSWIFVDFYGFFMIRKGSERL